MDKQATDNSAKQQNPNNPASGPGHKAGYQGNQEKATMDNKSDQQNPNNMKTSNPNNPK